MTEAAECTAGPQILNALSSSSDSLTFRMVQPGLQPGTSRIMRPGGTGYNRLQRAVIKRLRRPPKLLTILIIGSALAIGGCGAGDPQEANNREAGTARLELRSARGACEPMGIDDQGFNALMAADSKTKTEFERADAIELECISAAEAIKELKACGDDRGLIRTRDQWSSRFSGGSFTDGQIGAAYRNQMVAIKKGAEACKNDGPPSGSDPTGDPGTATATTPTTGTPSATGTATTTTTDDSVTTTDPPLPTTPRRPLPTTPRRPLPTTPRPPLPPRRQASRRPSRPNGQRRR